MIRILDILPLNYIQDIVINEEHIKDEKLFECLKKKLKNKNIKLTTSLE